MKTDRILGWPARRSRGPEAQTAAPRRSPFAERALDKREREKERQKGGGGGEKEREREGEGESEREGERGRGREREREGEGEGDRWNSVTTCDGPRMNEMI